MIRSTKSLMRAGALALGFAISLGLPIPAFAVDAAASCQTIQVNYRSEVIDGLDIAYREAGDPSRPMEGTPAAHRAALACAVTL